MRILLAQSSVYVPALGGANKSNRLLLEGLAARGHDCHAVAPAYGVHACATRAEFRAELERLAIPILCSDSNIDVFERGGVRVRAVADVSALATVLQHAVREITPDCIIVASEDPGQRLLACALNIAADRVVYLARTTMVLPCGPDSPIRSPARARLLSAAASVVAVSRFLRDYLERWGGIRCVELPICPNGNGPFPDYGSRNAGDILMVNPCAYKGLPIFLELARACRDLSFAAVPTWGTTADDLAELRAHRNVRLLDPVEDINEILSRARVLLVPSLWAEAKANMITEAMLRGIPVLASDVGGNSEAMLGVDYLLPVTPISSFVSPLRLDARMLPIAEVPAQDIGPWHAALRELLSTAESYRRVSRAARAAALEANETRTVVSFEQHLQALCSARLAH